MLTYYTHCGYFHTDEVFGYVIDEEDEDNDLPITLKERFGNDNFIGIPKYKRDFYCQNNALEFANNLSWRLFFMTSFTKNNRTTYRVKYLRDTKANRNLILELTKS